MSEIYIYLKKTGHNLSVNFYNNYVSINVRILYFFLATSLFNLCYSRIPVFLTTKYKLPYGITGEITQWCGALSATITLISTLQSVMRHYSQGLSFVCLRLEGGKSPYADDAT